MECHFMHTPDQSLEVNSFNKLMLQWTESAPAKGNFVEWNKDDGIASLLLYCNIEYFLLYIVRDYCIYMV
jgi:hypothetical protein